MSNIFILMSMIWCHIIDDYCLQGCLANLKQKDFWKKNAPDKLYKYDYIMALIMHSLSWSFSIMIPIFIAKGFGITLMAMIVWFVNAFIHGMIDHLKANVKRINLITDQTIHVIQIILTFTLFIVEVL